MAEPKYDYDALLRELRAEAEATFPGWGALTQKTLQPKIADDKNPRYGKTGSFGE